MFASDAEFAEHLHSMLHRFPVRSAAHNDGNFNFVARHRRMLTRLGATQNGQFCHGNLICALLSIVNTASIVLIGFMGAGKSAVGRELARRTGLPRYDTDEIIRHRFALSIPEIFLRHGETVFRDAETEVLRGLQGRAIVVTGGGIVLREENVRLFRALGDTIWLDADEAVLWQRASMRSTRPLLQTADPRGRFAALLRERLPLYEAAADRRIATSGLNITQIANKILGCV